MENSLAYKWVVILFFGVVGIIFTVSVIYLATGNVAPDTYWGRKMTLPKSKHTSPIRPKIKHVLKLDRGKKIGNAIFYYRGRQNDQIVFDVIIPELDRQYPYPFKIRLTEARKGFEVAGTWFQLIALQPSYISVKEMH